MEESDKLVWFILGAVLVIWFFGSPFGNEKTLYMTSTECKLSTKSYKKSCITTAVIQMTFRVNEGSQSVTQLSDDYGARRLADCAVFDIDNWSCGAHVLSKIGVKDGEFFGFDKIYSKCKEVSKINWWYTKLTEKTKRG